MMRTGRAVVFVVALVPWLPLEGAELPLPGGRCWLLPPPLDVVVVSISQGASTSSTAVQAAGPSSTSRTRPSSPRRAS
jgi:hypothetical protein